MAANNNNSSGTNAMGSGGRGPRKVILSNKYPWHVKEIPCQNTANCHDEKGHSLCHNCNPHYEKRLPCGDCGLAADGGRWTCCMKPTCYKCFDAARSCSCGDKEKGFFRYYEEPENAKELLAAAAAAHGASKKTAEEEPEAAEFDEGTSGNAHWLFGEIKRLKDSHDKAIASVKQLLASLPHEESVDVLRQLVFERVADCIVGEMNQQYNDVYDNDFDEYMAFNEDKLSINIDGKCFKFCMLPSELVDSLNHPPVTEPARKKQRKE
jgi:hypothetical protein